MSLVMHPVPSHFDQSSTFSSSTTFVPSTHTSLPTSSRPRTGSYLSSYSSHDNGSIRKRSPSISSTSRSNSNIRTLESLLPDQIRQEINLNHSQSFPNERQPSHRLSTQPHSFFETVPTRHSSTWSVPTPPRSDSGAQPLSTEQLPSTVFSTTAPPNRSVPTSSSADMGSLSYMMPPNYNAFGIDDQSMGSSGYGFDQSMRGHMPQQSAPQSYNYSQSSSFSHAPARTSSPMPMYQNTAGQMGMHNAYASMHHNPHASGSASIPRAMSSPMPAATLAPNPSSYASDFGRSPSMYDSMYGSPVPSSQQHLASQGPSSLSYPGQMYDTTPPQQYPRSLSNASSTSGSVRVLNAKPKPQCWEHGCNGREFSTFSNLLRHQREKSGTATKSYCPKCGAEFTRTTARNGHLAHDKCTKPRRSSEGR